jgi:hypothetical protein
MIHPYTKLYFACPNGLLIIAFGTKSVYSAKIYALKMVCIFSKIYYHIKVNRFLLNSASLTSTSEV